MNRFLFTILLLAQLQNIQAQNNSERIFLSPSGKRQLIYIELAEQYGTVFRLGRWLDKGGNGYTILSTDTITLQPGTNTLAGKTTTLQPKGGKLYLDYQYNARQKTKTIEVDTATNSEPILTDINNAYWWTKFFKLCDTINSTFELSHYSFRQGMGIWESFPNKATNHESFRIHTDNKIKAIKDSITAIHTPYVLLTNEIIKNIATIEYSTLKEQLSKLFADATSTGGYVGTIINSICHNRPELFFKLADDMPDKKEILFSTVYGKSAVAKLKAVETDSPSKKEFIKEKRKDRAFTIKAIGVAIAGAALLGFSLITLIK